MTHAIDPGLMNVRVIRYEDLLTKSGRTVQHHDFLKGTSIAAAAAHAWFKDAGRAEHAVNQLMMVLDGHPVPAGREFDELKDGAELQLAPRMGEITTATWIMIAIAVASAAASALMISSIGLPSAHSQDTPEEKRFGYSRVARGGFAGAVIPPRFGETQRDGGHIVSRIPVENETGDLDSALRLLICYGPGTIDAIGNQSADFDDVAAEDLEDVFLNDQQINGYAGVRAWGRMGGAGQAVIPGFEDVEVLREVGVGGVELVNTDGAERTGTDASSEAFTFTTLNEVNAVRVRVRLPGGLYTTSGGGQVESQRVKWRARTRTADVGSGAGSWSAWRVVDITKAQQSEFISALRLDDLNGGVAARMDVQVERVSEDADSLLIADRLLWDTVAEVTYDDNNYEGFALLGLYIPASEQVTTEPTPAAKIRGLKVLRWDRASSPAAPVFTRAWSDAPAEIAMEVITNTVWGMGARYSLSNIDLAAMFECLEESDTLVSTTSGGTRRKFACNLKLEQERRLSEWLAIIGRCGRFSVLTVGSLFRFVIDKARETPVEVFTDGSIAVDQDGVAVFEVAYELGTGGINRANQMTVQFENEETQGRGDAITWPQVGELWLGGDDAEQVNNRSVRMEGVTNPEQVFDELVYMLKRERFLTKAVTFETTRPVVATQPGDRADVAMSLPGWGLASGRIESGSTSAALVLDRSVTLEDGVDYFVKLVHIADGLVEDRAIDMPAGTYTAGEALTLDTPLAAAPGTYSEYSLGAEDKVAKPFMCTSVRAVDTGGQRWEISGVEYDPQIYDREDYDVQLPDFSSLDAPTSAPGPVENLTATEVVVDGDTRVSLAWTQAAGDRFNTAWFKVYWRPAGTLGWIRYAEQVVSMSGTVVDVFDLDRAYEFTVIAVSTAGAAMSPDDDDAPIVAIAFGLSNPALAAPASASLTQTSGNVYTLGWTAVTGAAGYQVLFGGTVVGTVNGGAEDCLVVSRVAAGVTSIAGLELPPGRSCTFWVRSINATGRLSKAAAVVTLASPAVHVGHTVEATKVFALDSEGTLTNLVWEDSRLRLVDASIDGVYLGPEVDLTTLEARELTFRPGTCNDAEDLAIEDLDLTAPSLEADAWGIVSLGPPRIGMLMPPYTAAEGDAAQAWEFEVRTHNGSVWGSWVAKAPGTAVLGTFQQWQIRVTMRRNETPYRPGLKGLAVVVSH